MEGGRRAAGPGMVLTVRVVLSAHSAERPRHLPEAEGPGVCCQSEPLAGGEQITVTDYPHPRLSKLTLPTLSSALVEGDVGPGNPHKTSHTIVENLKVRSSNPSSQVISSG